MNHTPGPWYTMTKPDAAQGSICQEHTGRSIAVSYDPKDARLIAAAPTLLVSLQALLCFIETPGDFTEVERKQLVRDATGLILTIIEEEG